MRSELDAWAFLRPLLLAMAAAASWIALSATAAAADSSPSHDSLLGTVGSSLSPVTTSIAQQAEDVQDRAVEDVAGLSDHLVQSVPLVNQVVPAGAVTAVSDPAVATVDGVVDSALGTLIPLASGVLEPLDSVLEPVLSAVPLPVVIPENGLDAVLPVVTDAIESTELHTTPAAALPTVVELPQVGDQAGAPPAGTEADTAVTASRPLSHHTLNGKGPADDLLTKPAAFTPLLSEAGPGNAPVHAPSGPLPAMPGATMGGSSSSSGNSPAMPAWLIAHHFQIPAAGKATVHGSLLTAPAPVSFDTGSSPD